MFWELLATVFAGFAGAGIGLIARKASRGRVPGSTTLILAGVFMFAFTVMSEMNWFPRQLEQLPDSAVVVATNESRAFYRPWTYFTPYVNRFIAVDTESTQTNPAVPDQRIVDVYLMERWQAARALQIGVDCAQPAQAPLSTAEFDEDGAITAARWDKMERDDPLVLAVCTGM
jgi:hypothetical protein